MAILTRAMEEFESVTGYPLKQYFQDYKSFLAINYTEVIAYYGGESESPDVASFDNLKKLIQGADKINEIFNSFRTRFERTDFWELMDLLEDMRGKLSTTHNASRWLRSAITNNGNSATQEVDHTLEGNQTLESVASTVVGSNDRQNDWINLAMRNDLAEEDYTSKGGNELKLTANSTGPSLSSVIDNLSGESLYGKDLYRVLTFDVAESDLKVLSPRDTMKQTVQIFSELRQGSNPEFPGDGIQTALLAASTQTSFSYPTLTRQLMSMFRKDDTIAAFRLTSLGTDPQTGRINIDFEIETRLGEFLVQSVSF